MTAFPEHDWVQVASGEGLIAKVMAMNPLKGLVGGSNNTDDAKSED